MCEKCVRSIAKAELSFGKINYFAHYLDKHPYGCIPLFNDKHSNLAIEGQLYRIRKAKTKRRYSRKNNNF